MIRRASTQLQLTDPLRLLLWMPAVSAAVGLLLLRLLHLSAPVYAAILLVILCFGLLALFGPARLRGLLLVAAPQVYITLLLFSWTTALYVLPDHPASGMVLLAASLHLPSIYVFLFLQWPSRLALRLASLSLALFIGLTLPHAWATRASSSGPYEGVGLPLTLLFAHGTLLAVLHSFSRARDELAHEQERSRLMRELAHRDHLTGLHNRRALEDDLAGAAAGFLLAVIDIDGLKQVNDTHGHAAGDQLLQLFGEGFRQGGGRAYRISGDEFALLMPDTSEAQMQARLTAVLTGVRRVFPLAAASMGLARREVGESPDSWLSRADQAMYARKRLARA
ncbi:sensor domain-containing diguanylate cyclase [Deinococcus gobiensis]|nr:GGDEF domain-containing protein [Deinococcus gobiensis]